VCRRAGDSEFVLITSGNETNEGEPAAGIVGEAADARIADAKLAKQSYLPIGFVTVLVHRLIREQVKASTAASPDRLAIRSRFNQIVKSCRIVPGADSKLASISATAISTDAECPRARLLRAQRPIDVHSFANHEHAVIRGKDFLRSVRSLYRYTVQHGSPKDYLFGRFDGKADADGGIGKIDGPSTPL